MNEQTLGLIDEALVKSRAKYENNRFMLSAMLREVAELTEALQAKDSPRRIREEAADAIAVLIRIIEEGDASFTGVENIPSPNARTHRRDGNTVNIFGTVHNSPISQGNKP